MANLLNGYVRLDWLLRWLPGLPWLILLAGLLLTGLLAAEIQRREDLLLRSGFEVRANELIGSFVERLATNVTILRGVTSLFDSSETVTRDEFRTYVAGLRLAEHYPGIQGVGFAQYVPAAARAAHVDAVRAEGFADYDLTPSGARDPYSAIVYLEPFDWRNRRAFGYDMFSEPVRRQAMRRAAETGEAALSGRVTLLQETAADVQPGFLVYLPIYRHGATLNTTEDRWAALHGWAYSPLRVRNLAQSYLQRDYPGFSTQIALRIHAGTAASPDTLLFDLGPRPSGNHHGLIQTRLVHGAPLTFQVEPLPAYLDAQEHGRVSRGVLVFGLAVSLLLALINRILTASHRRVADALAETSRARDQAEERQALLQAIYDSSSVGILLIDLKGVITHANRRLAEIFRQPLGQIVGQTYAVLMPPAMREQLIDQFAALWEEPRASFHLEQRFRLPDGSQFWGQVMGRAFHDHRGALVGIVAVIEDISTRRESEARIRHLAHHDYLTGLPNRAYLIDRAAQELALARRHGRQLAILFVDLDRFKPINDLHGHDAGDRVLCILADRLRGLLRESDSICRQGGDEFVILLPEFRDPDSLGELARKLLHAIEAPCLVGGAPLEVSASIGIALYPDHGKSVDELIQQADNAMYGAKSEGGGRIRFAVAAGADLRRL